MFEDQVDNEKNEARWVKGQYHSTTIGSRSRNGDCLPDMLEEKSQKRKAASRAESQIFYHIQI